MGSGGCMGERRVYKHGAWCVLGPRVMQVMTRPLVKSGHACHAKYQVKAMLGSTWPCSPRTDGSRDTPVIPIRVQDSLADCRRSVWR